MQDLFTKWLLVFPTPDQKSPRLVRLIVDELIPVFGVPEAILSHRGANHLSHLMMDISELLGIRKLNTTAYHPQCSGMVERFNRTLKGMLRAHVARFGNQWIPCSLECCSCTGIHPIRVLRRSLPSLHSE